MDWKDDLYKFEQENEWELSIELMVDVIHNNPDNMDAYLAINYLIMNILVEENYNKKKRAYYAGLLKKYFLDSYSKFSNNPEYLFYIGKIACMSEWYFDLNIEEAQEMIKQAAKIDPDNMLYKWAYFNDLDMRVGNNIEKMVSYAQTVMNDQKIIDQLKSKGSLGEYLLQGLEYWSKQNY